MNATTLDAMLRQSIRQSFIQLVGESLSPHASTPAPFDLLTMQECHILLLVSEGETNSAIAARMFLSPGTVRNYVSSILMKLQCANRAQAAGYAVKFQLESHLI